jgi:hypothetical protein
MISVGFRTNEALYWLGYGASYLSPEGGRPGSHTQAVSSIIVWNRSETERLQI